MNTPHLSPKTLEGSEKDEDRGLECPRSSDPHTTQRAVGRTLLGPTPRESNSGHREILRQTLTPTRRHTHTQTQTRARVPCETWYDTRIFTGIYIVTIYLPRGTLTRYTIGTKCLGFNRTGTTHVTETQRPTGDTQSSTWTSTHGHSHPDTHKCTLFYVPRRPGDRRPRTDCGERLFTLLLYVRTLTKPTRQFVRCVLSTSTFHKGPLDTPTHCRGTTEDGETDREGTLWDPDFCE